VAPLRLSSGPEQGGGGQEEEILAAQATVEVIKQLLLN
jgi:hypothetical protein